MRESLCVGLLRETKANEKRAPLTPLDLNWLVKRGINVEVESSQTRIFKDGEYKKAGATVLDGFEKAELLIGIKEPKIEDLYYNKMYMFFSHTTKGQEKNRPLLKAFLDRNITLIDYEKIVDSHNKRLVYFGRFAGICGLVDSLHYLGKKLEWKGFNSPLSAIQPAHTYGTLRKLKKAMAKLDTEIHNKGFDKRLSPFIIGVTGHGNVSRGMQEMLDILNPVEIHPKDMLQFIKHQKGMHNKIYKIGFLREEKFRSKDKKRYYLEEYLRNPRNFESNLDIYLPYLNLLINGSYWDSRFPRLITKKMINALSKKDVFRLEFIGDISCDINGSIELTYKTTSIDNPIFTYDPQKRKFTDGYKSVGVTMLAVDHLPTELPKDASQEFSARIRDYIYQIAAHGARDLIHHIAIPAEIRRAIVTQDGELTKDYKYLSRWIRRKIALQFWR